MLRKLEVRHFRCLTEASLEFDSNVTGIVGSNASGKTSLLEAIYFLVHGRGFRSAPRSALIQHESGAFRLVGRIQRGADQVVAGAEYDGQRLQLHVGGEAASSFSQVAALLPVQVIDPGVHRLIEEGSARRRRLLDWGVFHVEHQFLSAWRRYQRALQQRNAALRLGRSGELIDGWVADMDQSAQLVDAHRVAYFHRFRPVFLHWAARLFGPSADLQYRRGWAQGMTLADALRGSRAADERLRTTTVGPHRADLRFLVDGAAARERISRGQQKMLASTFALAQVAFQAEQGGPRTCLLLDDPAAELDVDNLGKLLQALLEIPAQLVVTAVTKSGLQGLAAGRMFHVKQGSIAPML